MPRQPKSYSAHGLYHVVVRGNGRQILFESDRDRSFFIERVYFCLKDEDARLLAWCLMDNHAHLLALDENDGLSTAMARINGTFAQRFNASSGHVGHVFQDRYLRKPIDSEGYLLEVVRYIHNNPEAAGICPAKDYPWSSYREYMGVPRFTDTVPILRLIGGRRQFQRFCKEKGDPALRLRCEIDPSEETLLDIAKDVIAPIDPRGLAALARYDRNCCLQKLRMAGFTLKQLERITGIGISTIHYATREYGKAS